MHSRQRIGVALAGVLLALTAPAATLAAPGFVAGGGYDYYQGAADQLTRGVLAIVGAEGGGGSASLTLMRYSDSLTGDGTGFVGAVGVPLAPTSSLRVWASRFLGDGTLRAWRVKAGPLLQLPNDGTAGLYYSHAQDNTGGRADGAVGELTWPFDPRFTGRAGGAFASVSGGLLSAEGWLGLGWAPVHGFELTGDVGLARNGALITSPTASRGGLLPLLGGGRQGSRTTEATSVDPLLSLGVRVLLP